MFCDDRIDTMSLKAIVFLIDEESICLRICFISNINPFFQHTGAFVIKEDDLIGPFGCRFEFD